MTGSRIKAATFATALAASLILATPQVSRSDEVSVTSAGPSPSASAAPADSGAPGQPTPAELKTLIKASQNPVGNIAVLPFQNNWNYGSGQTKTTVWNMNIEPVVPFMLNPKANLIERAIVPVVNLPPLLDAQHCRDEAVNIGEVDVVQKFPCAAQLGISNIQLQSYYAPKVNPNGFIYGVGPIFSFPTVTQNLGTQQFGAGLNAVGLVMPGPWVIGVLVTQRWDVAGPSTTPENTLNSFLAQPFINFNFGKGWALSEAPVTTANWNQPGDQKWTVPIGLGITNTNTWLKLPMSYNLSYYGNIVRPQYAPYGIIRFSWALIWPVKRGQ
jgi:hypothetical protein